MCPLFLPRRFSLARSCAKAWGCINRLLPLQEGGHRCWQRAERLLRRGRWKHRKVTTMTKEIDPYSTHMPILREYVPEGCRALEFGPGVYSTPFLLKRCAHVTSIEMQNELWYQRLVHEIEAENWDLHLALGPWTFLSVASLPVQKIDVALVDGHGDSRWGCVNLMMRLKVPVIIAHDTEPQHRRRYQWDRVIPVGYREEHYDHLTPHTTVWIKDDRKVMPYELGEEVAEA